MEEPDDAYAFARSTDEVTVDTADEGRHLHLRHARVLRPGKAQSTFADTRKAVDACGDGFTAKANGNESPYDSVTAEKVAPAGDESLGFTSTMTFRGVPHVLHGEVVRSVDVLAVYFSVDGMAIARPSDARLSPTIVKAQNGKLG